MNRFIAEDFRSLLDTLNTVDTTGVAPVVQEQPITETPMDKAQAIQALSQIRGIAKQHERTDQGPLPGNFANQIANDIWPVIEWLQSLPDPEPQQA